MRRSTEDGRPPYERTSVKRRDNVRLEIPGESGTSSSDFGQEQASLEWKKARLMHALARAHARQKLSPKAEKKSKKKARADAQDIVATGPDNVDADGFAIVDEGPPRSLFADRPESSGGNIDRS